MLLPRLRASAHKGLARRITTWRTKPAFVAGLHIESVVPLGMQQSVVYVSSNFAGA
jgi:hypothetical protein